jgi:hypothetical protein
MSRHRERTAARLGASDLARERARANGARRLLPWALLSAAVAAAIALAAGGGFRAAASLAAAGLLFAAFLWTTSLARCPGCGARLPRQRSGGASATAARAETCERCGTRFE